MSVDAESWSSFHRRHGTSSILSPNRAAFPGTPNSSSESPAGACLKKLAGCLGTLVGRSPTKRRKGGESAKSRRRREQAAVVAQAQLGTMAAVVTTTMPIDMDSPSEFQHSQQGGGLRTPSASAYRNIYADSFREFS